MERIILLAPIILGIGLVTAGFCVMLYRKRSGIWVRGTVTGVARSQKRYARVTIDLEAPAVSYEIDGQSYSAVSSKFFTEGTVSFKKGQSIDIRVNRKNKRKFVPRNENAAAEKILIACGTAMAAGCAVMILKYT